MAFPVIPVALAAGGIAIAYILTRKPAGAAAAPAPGLPSPASPASPASPSAPAYTPPSSPAAPAYNPPASPAAPAYVPPASPAAPQGQIAYVTTNDPPPDGDLIVRSGPGMSYPQTGGAQKNEPVTVLNANAGNADGFAWAQVSWRGGSRWPAITGYVKAKYLASSPAGAPMATAQGGGGGGGGGYSADPSQAQDPGGGDPDPLAMFSGLPGYQDNNSYGSIGNFGAVLVRGSYRGGGNPVQ